MARQFQFTKNRGVKMNKKEFLIEIAEILQVDYQISEDTILADLPEWDSMAYLGVMSFFEMEFDKPMPSDEIKKIKTVSELMLAASLEE